MFPLFARRHDWASAHQRLLPGECRDVVARLEAIIRDKYGFAAGDIDPWQPCTGCGYPTTRDAAGICGECGSSC